MKKSVVECCANSVQSALNGQAGGAQRIELCANLTQGGTTPSAATICLAREVLEIDLFVLIRPRLGNFVYTDLEQEEMVQDIEFCKEIGCDGVVLGALNADGSVNEAQTKVLVEAARPMQVTFHRAFDLAKDAEVALESIIACGCDRLLTSGQAPTAAKGVKMLRQLHEQAAGRIALMAGAGLDVDGVVNVYPTGIREFHLSGSKERQPASKHSLPGLADVACYETAPERIQEVIDSLEDLE